MNNKFENQIKIINKKRRWKNASLYLLVIIFSVGIILTIEKLQTTATLISEHHNEAIWSMLQLSKEYHQLNYMLVRFENDAIDYNELSTQYEILWSRFNVLLYSSEGKAVAAIPEAKESINYLFSHLKAIEERFYSLENSTKDLANIRTEFHDNLLYLYAFFNRNFKTSDDLFSQVQESIFELEFFLELLIIGESIAALLIIYILIRETNYHNLVANQDSLTGLPNRHCLFNTMNASKNTAVGFMLIDLDGFKDVNDTLGHDIGDTLLQQVSQRIARLSPLGTMAARLGGDEFSLFHDTISTKEEFEKLAEKLIASLNRSFSINNHTITISASIGISYQKSKGRINSKKLIQRADIAMYNAKKKGKNQFKVFNDSMNSFFNRAKQLQQDLVPALQSNQLCFLFQPIVFSSTKECESVEALLHWNHPQYGKIKPIEIFQAAKNSNNTVLLDQWVLSRIIKIRSSWKKHVSPSFTLWFNIFPTLNVEQLLLSATKEGLTPQQIGVQITENEELVKIEKYQKIINELKKHHVPVCLDDFCVEISPLNHLLQSTPNRIKVCSNIISITSNRDLSYLNALVNLAASLNIDVCAKELGSEDELEAIKAADCQFAQGALFSLPLSLTEFEQQAYCFGKYNLTSIASNIQSDLGR